MKLSLSDFRNQIKTKDVEGNRTYLSIDTDVCHYGQSYQNTVNTLENMLDNFTCFYYEMYEKDYDKLYDEFRDLVNSDPDFNYSMREFSDWLKEVVRKEI